jgi:Collagen triple helix repeat (20 copies)
VRNGSLRTVDLSKKAKAGLRGAPGPRGIQGVQGQRGPTGAQGAQGIAGTPGSPGLANLEKVEVQSANNSTTPEILYPSCPGDKRAISAGGYLYPDVPGSVALTDVFVLSNNSAQVRADEIGGGTASNWVLDASVVCADVQ